MSLMIQRILLMIDNIDTYLLMGEKEFFDKMKKVNRLLTSKERHIIFIIAQRFAHLRGSDEI